MMELYDVTVRVLNSKFYPNLVLENTHKENLVLFMMYIIVLLNSLPNKQLHYFPKAFNLIFEK